MFNLLLKSVLAVKITKYFCFKRIIEEAKKNGLEINSNETKYIIMGSTGKHKAEELVVNSENRNEYKSERTDKFVYLEVAIDEDGTEKYKLDAGMMEGNKK